jgi:hypothetical protein
MADYDDALLSPWRAAQLGVALDPAAGPEVADRISEKEVLADRQHGYEIAFLNWLGQDYFDGKRDDYLMTGEGGRTVGAFRRAMEKIEAAAKAGKIAGKRELANGQLQPIDGEFNAHEINFARGTLNGERVFLSRESILKLCASHAPAPEKHRGGRPKMLGPPETEWLNNEFKSFGLPSPEKPDWTTRQDVIDALREDFLKGQLGLSGKNLPSDKTIGRFVDGAISAWDKTSSV